MPTGSKLLVADAPEAIPLYHRILAPHYEVRTVIDFTAACTHVTGDVELVVCGVHFDESRMFEFFSTVRRNSKPFVCFRGLATPILPGALHVIKLAGEVLGAAGFIDFVTLSAEHGEERAVAQTLKCIEQALKGTTMECD
jgi:hypothetical protein